ncbi:MAG: CDGSH iron-sulfur domain-containing protein [Clostridia bacterium]
MEKTNGKAKLKIVKDGPYLVSGNVPLSEKIIVQRGKLNAYEEGRELPQAEGYALCRCGKSKNPPFCDGTHARIGFNGTETASREKYYQRAELLEGPGIDLLDDGRCAFARFCHREDGKAWDLTENSDQEKYKREAVQAACDCPAGRLVALEKTGRIIEPDYDPAIEIIQDPLQGTSGGIFVKGNIPIESADGQLYEVRNRVALCRCGKSKNKPFCDAMHTRIEFIDEL